MTLSYGDISLAVFREYRERHSPIARQKRREKKGSASLHSHRWECATLSSRVTSLTKSGMLYSSATAGSARLSPPTGRAASAGGTRERITSRHLANGGRLELSNLRLLCGGHNRLAAEKTMGKHASCRRGGGTTFERKKHKRRSPALWRNRRAARLACRRGGEGLSPGAGGGPEWGWGPKIPLK